MPVRRRRATPSEGWENTAVSPFDRAPQRRGAAQAARENLRTDFMEEVVQPVQPNLARGIVWADVLADIAADDEARRGRDLPEAA